MLQGTLERGSLHLGVRMLPDAASRLAWLTTYIHCAHGSGIIYCLTVSTAQEVAEHLCAAGVKVAAYTGQTEAAERERLEEDLKASRVRALVATSTLDMGFDKPDLAFMIRLGTPSSPVSYYQQVGRAGRGVERTEVVLLPGQEDRAIWEWSGSQGFPPEEQVRVVLDALEERRAAGDGAISTVMLETVTSLRHSRLESILKVLDVDGVVRWVRGGWESTGRPWRYDAQRYARVETTHRVEQETMVAYECLGTNIGPGRTTVSHRMVFLRSVLGDLSLEQGWRCGACDLCGDLDLPDASDQEQVGAAREAFGGVGVRPQARHQWPIGMDRLDLDRFKGHIGANRQAATGLAVSRLDGLGTSVALHGLVACTSDGEAPAALRPQVLQAVDRLTEIIRDEQEAAGSDGPPGGGPAVVVVDSHTRPRMVRRLGHTVATRLGAQALGVVGLSGQEPPQHDMGSAFHLAQVARSLTLQGWSAQVLDGPRERTVVLMDDWNDSGWTLTTAVFLLREAGAATVHPFVLAQRQVPMDTT